MNKKIVQLAADENIDFLNPGVKLLNNSGQIVESYFVDGLHPNNRGYQILGAAIAPFLKGR